MSIMNELTLADVVPQLVVRNQAQYWNELKILEQSGHLRAVRIGLYVLYVIEDLESQGYEVTLRDDRRIPLAELMSVTDAAEYLDVTRPRVHQVSDFNSGPVKTVKFAGRDKGPRFWLRESVDEYRRNRRRRPAAH